ncbi:uncharacterized protein LOC128230518 [Mya arenaria]|nr:uncharacterized protein LOC128230518 [Mya arenaria]XP_052798807.1 uncharacterized protein LOC128230518 [Mya arenaria]
MNITGFVFLAVVAVAVHAFPAWFEPEEQMLPMDYDPATYSDDFLSNDEYLLENTEPFVPVMKRSDGGLMSVSKRIHTCAFMRRLGLPIGLCLRGSRSRVSSVPRQVPEPAAPRRKTNPYAYLKGQWPMQHMLGGSVGKRK